MCDHCRSEADATSFESRPFAVGQRRISPGWVRYRAPNMLPSEWCSHVSPCLNTNFLLPAQLLVTASSAYYCATPLSGFCSHLLFTSQLQPVDTFVLHLLSFVHTPAACFCAKFLGTKASLALALALFKLYFGAFHLEISLSHFLGTS